MFSAIRDDRAVFEQVRVNPESGTVEWPGEIDLDPDALHGSDEPAADRPLERRIVETSRSVGCLGVPGPAPAWLLRRTSSALRIADST